MLDDFFDTEEVKEILRRFEKSRRGRKNRYINGHIMHIHDDSMVDGYEYSVDGASFYLNKNGKKLNKNQHTFK